MHTIRHILANKGGDIWSVKPEDTVFDAIRMMALKGVGALVVLDGDALHGMVSERDYARKVILDGRSSRETRVREICSSPAVTISPKATADEGLALMTRKRFRHLPVVEKGELLGVVSIGDLVTAVIGDQQVLIEQLERYVSG
ncbi:CBS domain-containing protein [Wenzhouxiangella marina]|uniref:Hypoxic response protein 1 n=1 Tax=Wenzhouxiangella marina TaxID=1579979 RepID=A0A0K0Y0E1_9GAMM|nr:CBS domain-containing protein [Wenzhouxiangella marina]AKS43413.1 Hypoxic response protein 1 [Wenzhouxiangella marina]MBB6088291.1 CBS domain-containing protein [Wenzhouxiangella marina]